MRILGIETSCDETGIAIYDAKQGLLAHKVHSQVTTHQQWGGVVPELAARDHLRITLPLIDHSLRDAGLSPDQLSGIAYTKGPGLIGALLIGATVARGLGLAWNLPTIGVHHLEGHVLAVFLESPHPRFPFLALLISGGHTELIKVDGLGQYTVLGETLDDAVGEAFDKTAKLLGLSYPGGAQLAKLAETGNSNRFYFPRPMVDRPGLDFSFSGLKTFALHTVTTNLLDAQTKADIACAFQAAVIDTLVIKCRRALELTGLKSLVVGGGVGANLGLRQALYEYGAKHTTNIYFPRAEFCTDNGAMIAYAGCQHLLAGLVDNDEINILPRWRLSS